MASGAAATIRQNVSRSKIQRLGKPGTNRSTDHAATAIRGGTGPVRRDTASVHLRGS